MTLGAAKRGHRAVRPERRRFYAVVVERHERELRSSRSTAASPTAASKHAR